MSENGLGSAMACVAALVAVSASACILPDRDINVITEGENPSPVRIVEPAPLSGELREDCDPACPLPQDSFLPHYLDPTDETYQFCSCAEGRVDQNALPGINLFAEDQDGSGGSGTDPLFAALLLDVDNLSTADPTEHVRYRGMLDPNIALQEFPSTYETDVILRPPPQLRQIVIADPSTGRFDLCNGSGVGPLSSGFHTLTLIVTDRPWYTAGDPGAEIQQEGVVDLLNGATYDTLNYVFGCIEDNEANADICSCEDPEEQDE